MVTQPPAPAPGKTHEMNIPADVCKELKAHADAINEVVSLVKTLNPAVGAVLAGIIVAANAACAL